MHKNYHRYNIVIKLFILFKKNLIYTFVFKKNPTFSKKSKIEKVAWYPGASPCRDAVIFKVQKIRQNINIFQQFFLYK